MKGRGPVPGRNCRKLVIASGGDAVASKATSRSLCWRNFALQTKERTAEILGTDLIVRY